MENGIYHLKYEFMKNRSNCNGIMLILSTKICGGDYGDYGNFSCGYWVRSFQCEDITSLCNIGTLVNSNPNFNNHIDGSIYEMIVDMNKREFSISHNNSPPILLVKYLPSPLYPGVSPGPYGCSVELLSVSRYE